MKVSINSKFIEGPYGGGVIFANLIRQFLVKQGVEVVNDLKSDDIDIILNVNPFPFLTKEASAYSFFDAYLYKLNHPETVIIERVNECDERKGTNYMNKLLVKESSYCDHVLFIASWLRPLLLKNGLPESKPYSVVLHGADPTIFNTRDKVFWYGSGPLKIVSHHWSDNPRKGHPLYKQLDNLLADPEMKKLLEFTYIGRVPEGINYEHSAVLPPLDREELGAELKKHHIYIIASENEPGGMSHVEGALCGLPLLYINSGSLPEYCGDYGLEFEPSNLKSKLIEMRDRYGEFERKIKMYDRTVEKMGTGYLNVMKDLYERRKEFRASRTSMLFQWCIRLYSWFFIKKFVVKRRLGMI